MAALSSTHVEDDENQKSAQTGMDQQFLDLFWKLADHKSDVRLEASVKIINYLVRHQQGQTEPSSDLKYTLPRIIRGLSSPRQLARHGFYTVLLGLLTTFPEDLVPNSLVTELIEKNLTPKGTKGEKGELLTGQVLAFGALIKAGRIDENGTEFETTVSKLVSASKQRSYLVTVAYSFLLYIAEQVSEQVFSDKLWPALQEELGQPWEQQNLDSLHLLLTLRKKFPKVIKKKYLEEKFDCSSFADESCYEKLCEVILRCTRHGDLHPFLEELVTLLKESEKLTDFWKVWDGALQLMTKAKALAAVCLLNIALKTIEKEQAADLLTDNVTAGLTSVLARKEEPSETALETLNLLKPMISDENSPGSLQAGIVEKLLSVGGFIAFDKKTGTNFVAEIVSSLKLDAVKNLSQLYGNFAGKDAPNDGSFEKIHSIHSLARLVSHPAVQGDNEWKSRQLIFLLEHAYAVDNNVPKNVVSAFREAFYRALDNPCKKLTDLCQVLAAVASHIDKRLDKFSLNDKARKAWQDMMKSVKKVKKEQERATSWIGNVFQVLYYYMGFQLFNEADMAADILQDLDACYKNATQKKKVSEEEPHWLEVVTDILLSLLSQNRHLLRSIVVSVWSLLCSHATPAVLQQILDVLDPAKEEKPLVPVDEEMDVDEAENGEEEEGEGSAEEEETGDEEQEGEEDEDGEEDDENEDVADEEDIQETVTDKLRMSIREALGDSGAVSDTESVDLDDLSESEMNRLDEALGAAFRQFRQERPGGGKKNKKLPKDQTALMHFRLRCLDLIEVLVEKEVAMKLPVMTLAPLVALLEASARDRLQKPLTDRTRSVLRKVTNTRKFSSDEEITMDEIVQLQESFFQRPAQAAAMMPFISDDITMCCSFLLRCALHMQRDADEKPQTPKKKKKKQEQQEEQPEIQLPGMLRVFETNLDKFFQKRDSAIPFSVFQRAMQHSWRDSGHLADRLIDYAFSDAVLVFRKSQAIQLLTTLYRNHSALSALAHQSLTLLRKLVQAAAKAIGSATSESKPKYFSELFVLLNAVHHYSRTLADSQTGDLWQPIKEALSTFRTRAVIKQADLKRSFNRLSQVLKLKLDAPVAVNGSKETDSLPEGLIANPDKSGLKKKRKKNRQEAAANEEVPANEGNEEKGEEDAERTLKKKRKKKNSKK